MPASDCGVCELLRCNANLTQEDWRLHVARMLCDTAESLTSIVDNGIPAASVQITHLPLTRVAAGSLTNIFVIALNDTNPKKYINIYNGTNAGILVSFDGGATIHDYLLPSTALVMRYGEMSATQAGTVALKYDTAATAGEVTISAAY